MTMERIAMLLLLAALAVGQTACKVAPRPDGTRADAAPQITEAVYQADSGLTGGWSDYGWAPRKLKAGGPAEVDFANQGGWIIARPDFNGQPGGFTFRFVAPKEWGRFLEVRLDSTRAEVFPRVLLDAAHFRDLPDGWTEVYVPMRELNPQRAAFDRVVLRAATKVSGDPVKLDGIGFTGESAADVQMRKKEEQAREQTPPRQVPMTIDCLQPTSPINPMIYGIAYDPRLDSQHQHQWEVGATTRRWGGNPASRYNWEHGRAWNTANDWFFRNVNYTGNKDFTYDTFLEENRLRGMMTALTLPTLGWVAKDNQSVSFPKSEFADQQAFAPEDGVTGNGVTSGGKPIPPGPPTRTSVAAPPAFIGRWVKAITEKDKTRGRTVQMYMLDNEPMLWNSTHRDVHPQPTTYDELREKLIGYGTEVRKQDPDAFVAGPGLWGWPAYFYSALDAESNFKLPKDRLMHGNVPLLPWIIRELKAHREKTGVRIIDAVDVHYYPQASNVGINESGATDEATSALRIRSTRALWDPDYVDESWIEEPVRLLPRLKEWIAQNDPGLGIVIGEWNFGAEHHMSGGLAVAESLGRFGQHGVTGAFYWTYPKDKSPAFWAFRAFRNYDGKQGRFLDRSVKTRAVHPLTSMFASRSEAGDKVVAVVLNLDPRTPVDAQVDLTSCGRVTSRKAYVYTGGEEGFRPVTGEATTTGVQKERLPAYSITVLELGMEPKKVTP